MNLIKISDVKKIYGKDDSKVEALRGIRLSVEKGDMLAIMGSGKSTLLNIIGFLDKATEGKTVVIITHDEKVAKMCKRIIYIEDGRIKEGK